MREGPRSNHEHDATAPEDLGGTFLTVTIDQQLTPTLRLERFTSLDAALALGPEWDDLTSRLNGSLYSSAGWCGAWWRHYGAGRELRLFAVRVGEELMGVLPFFIDRLLLPIGRARVAKVVGSDSTVAVIEPLVEASAASEAFSLAIRELFEDDRVGMVHLGPCSSADPHIEAFRRGAGDVSHLARPLRDREYGSHTFFDVSEGFDGYLRGMNSHQRSNYRRKIKKFSSSFEVTLDIVSDPSDLEREFAAFVDMHQTQWKALNKLGHFGDWRASREFSWDLVRTLAPADRVRLVRLLADGQVVAYYWCFALNGTYYWRLSARLLGEQWDKFALGRVGVVKMIEAAAAEDTTEIEAGVGSYGYKENLNATTLPLHSVVLSRRGLLPELRARLTLACGELLDLVYYRVWYLRIAPRAGILRRPLWRSWIRTRL
jgi:CelD/BcsL family acetyltransferase involved in cellulose biosynthesis